MDWIREVGDWTGRHWSDVGTVGMFLFTGVVAWTAIVGHRLNQRLTDAELDPAVVVYIESRRYHFSTFELVIRNVGRGAARNVMFGIEPGFAAVADRAATRLLNMAIFKRGIPFLGPSQEIRTYYGSFRRLEAAPLALHLTFSAIQPSGVGKRCELISPLMSASSTA